MYELVLKRKNNLEAPVIANMSKFLLNVTSCFFHATILWYKPVFYQLTRLLSSFFFTHHIISFLEFVYHVLMKCSFGKLNFTSISKVRQQNMHTCECMYSFQCASKFILLYLIFIYSTIMKRIWYAYIILFAF